MAVTFAITALVLGSSWQVASANAASTALGFLREAYTTNAICSKKNCINPVFPGMEDLHRLAESKWLTSSLSKTQSSMGFCKNAISYDPALPIPDSGGSSIKALVMRQDNAASTMFYFHLAGLGLEAWDYQKPEFADDCIKSIWRMVCYTYFPRAQIGTQDGAFSNYIKPCQSSCQNYVRSCQVECCDESVQCVFEHKKAISATMSVTTSGYAPHDGPSSLCTGAARRSASPLGGAFWVLMTLKAIFSLDGTSVVGGMRSLFAGLGGRKVLFMVAMVVVALSLQGCDYDVPIHRVGNWRAQPDYLIDHEFIPPGGSPKSASINSCSIQHLSQALQCSGRGVCRMWSMHHIDNTLAFCECDRDWADPECRTARKSQMTAYVLSVFLGMFGADQFYLGFYGPGILKLLSFGGFGIWWIVDIIRIGSAAPYTKYYRTATDLPHYAYVVTVVAFALFLGFFIAFRVTTTYRARKRQEAMLLSEEEENRQSERKPFGDAYMTGTKKPQIKNLVPYQPPMTGMGYGAMPMGSMRMP